MAASLDHRRRHPGRPGPAGLALATLSGLSASLVGIGLARFVYTPLIPALVSAHWFTESTAAYLGAANLAGYLAGALFGRDLDSGARYWVLYGLGAAAGPLLAGRLADRIGFRSALRRAFLAQAFAVAPPVVLSTSIALAVSSVVVGAFTPGIVPLVLGRVHELVEDAAIQRRIWSHAAAFALAQATAAYGYSYLFAATGSYALLFNLGALALLIALGLDVAVAVASRSARRGGIKRECPTA